MTITKNGKMNKTLLLKTQKHILLEKLLKEFYDFTQEGVNSEVLSEFRYGIELEGYFSFEKTKIGNRGIYKKVTKSYGINSKRDPDLKNIQISINTLIKKKLGIENFLSHILFDGSLNVIYKDRKHFGFEFVTRILSFDEFRNYSIPALKNIIRIFDVKFDETCGFHISFSHPEFPDNPKEINWLKVYILSGLYESGMKYDRINSSYAREIIGHINNELIHPYSNFNYVKFANMTPNGQRIFIKVLGIIYKLLKGENLSYKESIFLAKRSSFYFNDSLIKNKYNAINLASYSNNKRIEIRLFGRNAPYDFEEVVKRTINVSLAAYFVLFTDNAKYNKIYYETFHNIINDNNYKKSLGVSTRSNKVITPDDFLKKIKRIYNMNILSKKAKEMLKKEIPELLNS